MSEAITLLTLMTMAAILMRIAYHHGWSHGFDAARANDSEKDTTGGAEGE